jgi:hypothetical protein
VPRASRRKDQPDPDQVYVAWQGGAADVDGVPVTWGQGDRLRGDSLAVRGAFWCFVPDGTERVDWPNVHAAAAEQNERQKRIRAAEGKYDYRTPERPVELNYADWRRCTKSIRIAYGRNVDGIPESFGTVEKGALVAADDPIVERVPSAFEEWQP